MEVAAGEKINTVQPLKTAYLKTAAEKNLPSSSLCEQKRHLLLLLLYTVLSLVVGVLPEFCLYPGL